MGGFFLLGFIMTDTQNKQPGIEAARFSWQ